MIVVVLHLALSSPLFIKLSSMKADDKPAAANTWEGVDVSAREE